MTRKTCPRRRCKGDASDAENGSGRSATSKMAASRPTLPPPSRTTPAIRRAMIDGQPPRTASPPLASRGPNRWPLCCLRCPFRNESRSKLERRPRVSRRRIATGQITRGSRCSRRAGAPWLAGMKSVAHDERDMEGSYRCYRYANDGRRREGAEVDDHFCNYSSSDTFWGDSVDRCILLHISRFVYILDPGFSISYIPYVEMFPVPVTPEDGPNLMNFHSHIFFSRPFLLTMVVCATSLIRHDSSFATNPNTPSPHTLPPGTRHPRTHAPPHPPPPHPYLPTQIDTHRP